MRSSMRSATSRYLSRFSSASCNCWSSNPGYRSRIVGAGFPFDSSIIVPHGRPQSPSTGRRWQIPLGQVAQPSPTPSARVNLKVPMATNLDLQALALDYHRRLPLRLRNYLNDRGIPDQLIHSHLLGWDGRRITIPITVSQGAVAFFKLAKDPADASGSPKMLFTPGARAELYGWDRVLAKPDQIIICEGEFDRLVLESKGFAAVTSTGGA